MGMQFWVMSSSEQEFWLDVSHLAGLAAQVIGMQTCIFVNRLHFTIGRASLWLVARSRWLVACGLWLVAGLSALAEIWGLDFRAAQRIAYTLDRSPEAQIGVLRIARIFEVKAARAEEK